MNRAGQTFNKKEVELIMYALDLNIEVELTEPSSGEPTIDRGKLKAMHDLRGKMKRMHEKLA